MVNTEQDDVLVRIGCSNCSSRSWLVRIHLTAGHDVDEVLVDESPLSTFLGTSNVAHTLMPTVTDGSIAPALQGVAGAAPPSKAGPVVELELPPGQGERSVRV